MSGHWEYIGVLDTPCRCGAGRFVVREKSENYPPFRNHCEGWVDCPTCTENYQLAAHDADDIRFYRKDDLATHAAIRDAKLQRGRDFLAANPIIQEMRKDLLELLGGASTKAGKYSALRERDLVSGSLDTFRRHYQSDEATTSDILFWTLHNPKHSDVIEVVRQERKVMGNLRDTTPFEQLARRAA